MKIGTLDCTILTTEAQIEALAGEWRDLYTRTQAGPFADYNLFDIWWRHIGKTDGERMLHVITGRDDGRLAAVLPLTVVRRKGLRIMQAAGFRAYNCDMPAETPEAAVALWQAARSSPYYDFASIRDVYPDSVCYQALESFARRRDLTDSFYLRFEWPTSKDWIASMPVDARGKFNRCTRRLTEKGPVEYQLCQQEPVPAVIVDAMVKQKIKWAHANKKPGLFYYADVLPYFHEMLDNAAKQGRLFLAWLKCGDDVIAYNQGFVHQGVIHMAFWTFDPAFARFSPGNVIFVNSVCWAIDNGLLAVNMRQGESQLKRKHANEVSHCAEFTFSGAATGRMLEGAYMTGRRLLRLAKSAAPRLAARGN